MKSCLVVGRASSSWCGSLKRTWINVTNTYIWIHLHADSYTQIHQMGVFKLNGMERYLWCLWTWSQPQFEFVQRWIYLPGAPWLWHRLQFRTDPGWGALSRENAVCPDLPVAENDGLQVVWWNGPITPHSQKMCIFVKLISFYVFLDPLIVLYFLGSQLQSISISVTVNFNLNRQYYPWHFFPSSRRDISTTFTPLIVFTEK